MDCVRESFSHMQTHTYTSQKLTESYLESQLRLTPISTAVIWHSWTRGGVTQQHSLWPAPVSDCGQWLADRAHYSHLGHSAAAWMWLSVSPVSSHHLYWCMGGWELARQPQTANQISPQCCQGAPLQTFLVFFCHLLIHGLYWCS